MTHSQTAKLAALCNVTLDAVSLIVGRCPRLTKVDTTVAIVVWISDRVTTKKTINHKVTGINFYTKCDELERLAFSNGHVAVSLEKAGWVL